MRSFKCQLLFNSFQHGLNHWTDNCYCSPTINSLVSSWLSSLSLSLPDQREALLLRHMIHTDLSQLIGSDSLAWLKEIYLKSNFDLFGEGTLREYGLHLWHNSAGHHATLRPNGVHLLADTRHHRKVLREVVGDEPTDTSSAQIVVKGGQVWSELGISWLLIRSIIISSKKSSSPSGSKHSLSTSWTISSALSIWCSRQVSPLSERKMTISRSFPRNDAK